ncbi:MAG: LytR C-terminal domain-containing protein [Actinobacteria bacterium]|nr:LytR C-terminal domain-containing protein [Actinomycetota bacterium]
MGQHSSPSEWHFYRSVIVWFLPWVVIAGVIGVAVWIGVDALSGGEGSGVVVAQSPTPRTTPKTEASPTPEESPSKKPTKSPRPSPKATKTPDPGRELITEGISVQVLNGSGVAGADEAMATKLTDLGFDVAAVQSASAAYPRTTVFWSFAESKRAAQALAARFGWVSKAKPDNLSATVDIHVVVGADEG